ncbi:hypothetical protein ACOMHN_056409 [Nucella lapillus]
MRVVFGDWKGDGSDLDVMVVAGSASAGENFDFSDIEIDTSIEEFFSKEEYKNMCDLEKRHLKNIRLNYEMMLKFGGGKGQRKTRQKAEKPKEERRQYCFRKRKEVNYMTLEVPNDDEFIYCEECDQEFQGDCPEHGPFHVVDDTAVEVKKRGDPQRAVKTLPPGLEVRKSGIPNAGLGAFATQLFPTRSRFGPYQGRRVTDPDIAHASGYCWQISSDEGYSYFVDAKDCKAANWMTYVNCARTRAEQNVTAYQHCGEVYYRAHCDIQPGTEILMWYGREYGKELGIIREEDEPRKKKRPSVTQLEPDRDKDSDEHLTCSDSDVRTSDIEFSDSDDSRHQQNINNRPRVMEKPPTHTPSLARSANTPGSLLSLDRSHVCHRCSAAFVLFNSLKLHVKHVHGENLQVVLPVASTPDGCGDGNHGDNMGKDVVNAINGKAVERMKEESDRKNIGKKDERKVEENGPVMAGEENGPVTAGEENGPVTAGENGPVTAGEENGPVTAGENGPVMAGENGPVIAGDENGPVMAGENGPVMAGENGPVMAGENGPVMDGENGPDDGW